ncbi:hypothetical protein EVAR_95803_1 [Eumeta japonica]|uniref:Uncharacterized protein n=1 Tax=Eumeta variegata TaxID=151549 RepID=A0A4C1W3M6_EUMVA|nr:hypothetical protein EVAR_95803_1 [Eumeta japonica]
MNNRKINNWQGARGFIGKKMELPTRTARPTFRRRLCWYCDARNRRMKIASSGAGTRKRRRSYADICTDATLGKLLRLWVQRPTLFYVYV